MYMQVEADDRFSTSRSAVQGRRHEVRDPDPRQPAVARRIRVDARRGPSARPRRLRCAHAADQRQRRAGGRRSPGRSDADAAARRSPGGRTRWPLRRSQLPEATIAQRLSRAKRTIAAKGSSFGVVSDGELVERLDAVAMVLYLIFTEGHVASSGEAVDRVDLSAETIRLTRLLHAARSDAEVTGLLALMLLTDARRPACTTATGDLVTVAYQDRSLWDVHKLREGLRLTRQALTTGAPGPTDCRPESPRCTPRRPTPPRPTGHRFSPPCASPTPWLMQVRRPERATRPPTTRRVRDVPYRRPMDLVHAGSDHARQRRPWGGSTMTSDRCVPSPNATPSPRS